MPQYMRQGYGKMLIDFSECSRSRHLYTFYICYVITVLSLNKIANGDVKLQLQP